ncbi:hypothetical protein [Bdellovibrio sp. HCB2-146]|uniref:hypothetical protein n=1 Tax=Bdellovibrio sp. HCB2-146 TaxID=3394362 RepID=UPI0039BC3CCD
MARHFDIERNFFYSLTPYCTKESVFSISACDYSTTMSDVAGLEIQKQNSRNLVLSSTAFEKLDSRLEAAVLPGANGSIRLQVSVGAELHRLQNVVLRLLQQGCGLDILIDRPLSPQNQTSLESLSHKYDVRFCLMLNKYFSLTEIIHSLPQTVMKKSFMLIVPPNDSRSIFYSADHVIHILNDLLFELPILVFENLVAQVSHPSERAFFTHFNLDTTLETASAFANFKNFRTVLLWLMKRQWIFLLDLLHSGLLFIRHPSGAKLQQLGQTLWQLLRLLKGMLGKLSVHLYNFIRYKVWHFIRYQFWHFIRYQLWHFIRYQIWGFVRYQIWGFVRFQVWNFIRYDVVHFFLYKVYPFIKYDIIQRGLSNSWRLREGMRILAYPFLKVYWFASYQVETRLLPLLKKGTEKE